MLSLAVWIYVYNFNDCITTLSIMRTIDYYPLHITVAIFSETYLICEFILKIIKILLQFHYKYFWYVQMLLINICFFFIKIWCGFGCKGRVAITKKNVGWVKLNWAKNWDMAKRGVVTVNLILYYEFQFLVLPIFKQIGPSHL